MFRRNRRRVQLIVESLEPRSLLSTFSETQVMPTTSRTYEGDYTLQLANRGHRERAVADGTLEAASYVQINGTSSGQSTFNEGRITSTVQGSDTAAGETTTVTAKTVLRVSGKTGPRGTKLRFRVTTSAVDRDVDGSNVTIQKAEVVFDATVQVQGPFVIQVITQAQALDDVTPTAAKLMASATLIVSAANHTETGNVRTQTDAGTKQAVSRINVSQASSKGRAQWTDQANYDGAINRAQVMVALSYNTTPTVMSGTLDGGAFTQGNRAQILRLGRRPSNSLKVTSP